MFSYMSNQRYLSWKMHDEPAKVVGMHVPSHHIATMATYACDVMCLSLGWNCIGT